MRKNYNRKSVTGKDNRTYLEGDWYAHGIPSNVSLADNVFIDTSYGFAGFRSGRSDALSIGEASGCYDGASFIVSESGKISVGKFSILNGSTIICNLEVIIGDYCMLAWGSVITDNWPDLQASVIKRQHLLENAAADDDRNYPLNVYSKPVVIEDNVWVGFDAVIMPGVTLGKGCVVACKTVIDFNVPAYAVIAGSPARIVKHLSPDDTEEVRAALMKSL